MEHLFYEIEFREDGSALSGLAIPFNKPGVIAKNGHLMQERIAPGALSYDDVILTREHDNRAIMARTPSTLSLVETAEGIVFSASPPDSAAYRETRALIKEGVLRGVSAEFFAEQDNIQGNNRVIEKGRLIGISVVARPAYPQTQIQARARRRLML